MISTQAELRRQVIEHVSGLQTGVKSHMQTTDSIVNLVNTHIETVLDRLDKSMPTQDQLTKKYGYHMPDKQYGYSLALHDIREVLEAERKQLKGEV